MNKGSYFLNDWLFRRVILKLVQTCYLMFSFKGKFNYRRFYISKVRQNVSNCITFCSCKKKKMPVFCVDFSAAALWSRQCWLIGAKSQGDIIYVCMSNACVLTTFSHFFSSYCKTCLSVFFPFVSKCYVAHNIVHRDTRHPPQIPVQRGSISSGGMWSFKKEITEDMGGGCTTFSDNRQWRIKTFP